ncbi:alpha/beta hydrolase-fold protein [Spongiivirga citrea]|uniref:Uncharacterized protein n=1 Tax=Spongiivirga citrea TaxID=1481457 RepID=A0A6M0CHK4_9FLAO|nr:alpha/beta hydrolase-fold protein [Spongiivirga citrea]NER17428.1 hypothetical protein [Spongiivirga citrea]
MGKTFFVALLLFLNTHLFAQKNKKINEVGSIKMFNSESLGDLREIQIFLPEDYSNSQQNYPVLYVLDGQRYFLHAVSLQKSFIQFRQTPGFIIVGINKKQSDRNRNYNSNSKIFLEFIENEVIRYIDSEFRTSDIRMLFGWGYAGGFVFETMTSNPELFDAYIAASPFPLESKISKIDGLISNVPGFDSSIYFTSEIEEGGVLKGSRQLRDLLSTKASNSLRWTFKELKEEEHRSTPFTSLYHGITKYFEYYPELQFKNLEEYEKEGGFDNVLSYHKKRASQYGFAEELSDWTMFSLTRNVIRAKNLDLFDFFMKRFEKSGFIERLNVSRSCLIAEFYLENNRPEKAIEIFKRISNGNPASIRPLQGLAESYLILNKKALARKFFKKVEKLNEQN